MTWTSCYDDGCLTHLSDKEGSGHWPGKPRGRSSDKVVFGMLRGTLIEEWINLPIQQTPEEDTGEGPSTVGMATPATTQIHEPPPNYEECQQPSHVEWSEMVEALRGQLREAETTNKALSNVWGKETEKTEDLGNRLKGLMEFMDSLE
jgi:hypothetical protein